MHGTTVKIIEILLKGDSYVMRQYFGAAGEHAVECTRNVTILIICTLVAFHPPSL